MSRISLTDHALQILEARYLLRDDSGQVVETPEQLFRRVARNIADAENVFSDGGRTAAAHWEEQFFDAMTRLDFLPNSPTLMNAGTSLGQLSACFVLPIEDSLPEIFDSLKLMALIQQTAGGTGFSFSKLRARGTYVKSTGGRAAGPIAFMRIFDCTTENIYEGGKRRGANMGVLRIDHPDVFEFVSAKSDRHSFRNFNLSVGVTDLFMQAVIDNRAFPLIDPNTGDRVRDIKASELLAAIAEAAWNSGDPGMLFLDTINRANPTPALGRIEATNPCGEVPLLPYEACNLGSINLSHMLAGSTGRKTIDWDRLARTVALGVRFLDNVIEVSKWPSDEITAMARGNRKIGLGVMGFADALIELDIPYDSDAAVQTARQLMQFIADHAAAASEKLAVQRGSFPNWSSSRYASENRPMRNATRTSIAPTGTIGILAGTSASIEPLFALAYVRENILDGQMRMVEYHPLFLQHARETGIDSPALREALARDGTLDAVPSVPEHTRRLFKTALSISPERHLQIQAAFQQHVDNAVSKTINLPHRATAQDIADIYLRAWQLGLKGTTVYRYGSKDQQVLRVGIDRATDEVDQITGCGPNACRV